MAAESPPHRGAVAKQATVRASPAGKHGSDGIMFGDQGIILVTGGEFSGRVRQAVQVLHWWGWRIVFDLTCNTVPVGQSKNLVIGHDPFQGREKLAEGQFP